MVNSIGLEEIGDSLVVDVQNALSRRDNAEHDAELISDEQLSEWANLAYSQVSDGPNEVTIRLVDEDEITQLNRDYRGKDKPTNVLSFPVESDFEFIDQLEGDADFNLLGDVIICHSVIVNEAKEQSKKVSDHYAHMVVHGILHLCGYDHQDEQEAEQMEALEVKILAVKQIANPYSV